VIGLPLVLVVAWYHGDRGQQTITGAEVLIIALLVLVGGAVLWLYEPAGEAAKARARRPGHCYSKTGRRRRRVRRRVAVCGAVLRAR